MKIPTDLREPLEAQAKKGTNLYLDFEEAYMAGAEAMLKAVLEKLGDFDHDKACVYYWCEYLRGQTPSDRDDRHSFEQGAKWKHEDIVKLLKGDK
jgi:hypothetical protein